MPVADLVERCRTILQERWEAVQNGRAIDPTAPLVTQIDDIAASVNSDTKTFRYVLPTQLLAKVADPTVDCRSVQARWNRPGAFDARSVAHEVVVPFDRDNHNVLGGSAEPYVSKPLRCLAIIPEFQSEKRDRAGWARLCNVLDAAQDGEAGFVIALLDAVLSHVLIRLDSVHVTYPVPNRISLPDCVTLITAFLEARTGGVRFQTVVAALFETLGKRFGMFESIRTEVINSADSQSGAAADVECLDRDGRIVMAVEAKDRHVTIRHIEDKLPSLREQGIREAFFISSAGPLPDDHSLLESLIRREFVAGQNLYLLDLSSLSTSAFALFGEEGRREFLIRVGSLLDRLGRLSDRQEWARRLTET